MSEPPAVLPVRDRPLQPSVRQLACALLATDPHMTEQELNALVRGSIIRRLFRKLCACRRQTKAGDAAPLPVDMLGQVYEQLLGNVIRLDADRQVRIEENRYGAKATGTYYTPRHLVDYVVQHTVGRLLQGRTPDEIADLTILDPACGTGVFLLAGYQYLLDWYRDRYVETGAVRHSRELGTTAASYRLSFAQRWRILRKHIYGIDIDPQAVEVTRLSLLLKALEGRAEQPVSRKLLAEVSGNVKCGNSLLGPDFQHAEIKAFDWHAEFPAPQQAAGFRAVLGNPPWGQKSVAESEAMKRYLRKRYPSCRGIYDLFRPFVDHGIGLLQPGGMFGMVLPDIVLLKDYVETRRLLLDQLALEAIDWWGMAFPGATIDAATIIGSKRPAPPGHCVRVGVHDPQQPLAHAIPQSDFRANPRSVFNLYLTADKRCVLEMLAACHRLGDYFEIHEGVHSGNLRKELFVAQPVDDSCRRLYFGRSEISRYHLEWQGRYLRLAALPRINRGQRTVGSGQEARLPIATTRFPLPAAHCLAGHRYANVGKPEWHERPKLLVRRTGDHVLAAVDRRGYHASNNFFLIIPREECLLDLDGLCALLNSQFMTWYFRTIEPRQGRVFAELKIKHLKVFPLPLASAPSRQLNRLGARRAQLAAELAQSTEPRRLKTLQNKVKRLDARLDTLVYTSLGLSDIDRDGILP